MNTAGPVGRRLSCELLELRVRIWKLRHEVLVKSAPHGRYTMLRCEARRVRPVGV